MKPADKTVRIGTRGSALALSQARGIRAALVRRYPHKHFEIVVVKTTGDEYQSVELFKKNNIGVFTKEIEGKLLSGEIDIAVHSLKDLPTDLPDGLVLAAYPKRLDTRDVLISKKRYSLKTLPAGAGVATGSPRRKSQLAMLRPDLRLFDIRGNLDTRIKRVLKNNHFDAVMLARAGLLRLNKFLKYAVPVAPGRILPAVGQAALGLEARSADASTRTMLKRLNHRPTEIRVRAERAFLKALGGGCRVPVGVHSQISGGFIRLQGRVFSVSGPGVYCVQSAVKTKSSRFEQAGITLAKRLLKRGAGKLMKQARRL